ncbi:hypothetical protein FPSE5266_06698 [Fusarium pseudograminearum]|nr:hypothetical protein FPSE5266_06698 [Fusarium pseudograminearum]
MVSNKLIVSAFAVLASMANASPCKPSSTVISTTETTSAGFTSNTETASATIVETSTFVTETETAAETTADATSTIEASTTVSEAATTTTTVDGPLITNAGFEDGTTAPWELISEKDDNLVLAGGAYEGTALGKVEFGVKDGAQYGNIIMQKINKKVLVPGSYSLEGWTRVDYFSETGDGCSNIIAACLRGSVGGIIPVPGSAVRKSAESAVEDWYQIATTCTITQDMIDADLPINVVFGFNCAEAGAYLDSVELKLIDGTETPAEDTTTTTQAAPVFTQP